MSGKASSAAATRLRSGSGSPKAISNAAGPEGSPVEDHMGRASHQSDEFEFPR